MSEHYFLQPPQTEMGQIFQQKLLHWFIENGRHALPWKPSDQQTQKINLYRVWISEIMLQQTQVVTVIPYFENFMTQFPTPESLADADIDDVLKAWEGLGYYSRARNLHVAAKMIKEQHKGIVPDNYEALLELKGIGPTTAAAILSQGYNRPYAILDGNVRRVLARILGCTASRNRLDRILQPYANHFASKEHPADYTQAIMDFGATLCARKALCDDCFFQSHCLAFQYDEVSRLPRPNEKKKKPIVKRYLLIFMQDNGKVIVERRKNSGIWAGLYSFPELDFDDALDFWLEERAIKYHGIEALAEFSHHFSHYQLDGVPKIIHLNEPFNDSWFVEGEFQTLTTDDFRQLPKPKPIVDLLEIL